MLQTRKSNPNKPVRLMVYGVEGVGKSTLGAKSDRPVFITPEGGSDQLTDIHGNPVDEIQDVVSWDRLRGAVKDLLNQDHNFKTVVFDSADWIEGLCHREIIGNQQKTIVTAAGGYGAGYRQSQNMHQALISDIEELRIKRDMNIIITAHAHVRPVKDPESLHDYDAFEIKCHEMVSSLWREYVDALLFARFKTITKVNDETVKARAMTDGSRVIYTVKQPAFQAKNRYGLPPEMEFTENFWKEFMGFARRGVRPETVEQVRADIDNLKLEIKDEVTLSKVNEFLSGDKTVNELIAVRSRLQQLTGRAS